MTRAIPGALGVIPLAFTAHVSAGSVNEMQLALRVAVGTYAFAVMEDDSP